MQIPYRGEKKTVGLLLEEWADFLQVNTASDVLDVRTVLHVGNIGAITHAQKSWASLLGKLATFSAQKWTSS